MRMFVAIVPPPEVLEHLQEFLVPRQEVDDDLRWTAPEQWHITLAFMGHAPERSLDDLHDRLGRAAARRTRFAAAVAGGGAFPNPARAKVLYAGIELGESREEVRRLATGARAAANKAGAEAGGGRFHPHLTLARIRRPTEVSRWLRVLDTYRGPAWLVEEITLIRSHLGEGPRGRPRYELVETFRLLPAASTERTERNIGETAP